MKIILSSRRRHYLARIGLFLITAALIAGMLGCASGGEAAPPSPYYVLITNSTAGGSVTIPGEGTFTYDPGELVDLVAEAEEGYRFVE
jgi:hypothetical protein